MTSDEDQDRDGSLGDDEDEDGDEDEVPPPKIVKIEDAAAPSSPYESLDGSILARDDAVAVARLDAESITGEYGDGVLVGQSIATLAYVIGGDVRVREIDFVKSVDLGFTANEVESTLDGHDSTARRGAERLVNALASRDRASLLRTLGGAKEPVIVRLEELLQLLFKNGVTIDVQIPATTPIRVLPERAYALYLAIREPIAMPPKQIVAPGRLVGAIADTQAFKLRLDEKWNSKSVIEGTYRDGLEAQVEHLWNKDVLARITYVEERRGPRTGHYRFMLDNLQPAARLPLTPSS